MRRDNQKIRERGEWSVWQREERCGRYDNNEWMDCEMRKKEDNRPKWHGMPRVAGAYYDGGRHNNGQKNNLINANKWRWSGWKWTNEWSDRGDNKQHTKSWLKIGQQNWGGGIQYEAGEKRFCVLVLLESLGLKSRFFSFFGSRKNLGLDSRTALHCGHWSAKK